MNAVERQYREFRAGMAAGREQDENDRFDNTPYHDAKPKPPPLPKDRSFTKVRNLFIYGSYPRQGLVERVVQTILSGNAIRPTSRICRVSHETVRKIFYQVVEQAGLVYCKCGRPITHRGFCSVRTSRSPARQKFLKQWQQNKLNRERANEH